MDESHASHRTPHPLPSAVAAALADAFLAADAWVTKPLIEAGAFVMGARRRWLAPVVGDVMSAFARPPLDAPRLLTSLILNSAAFAEAVRKADERRSPLRIAHQIVASPNSPGASRLLPRIDSIPDLAALLDLDLGQLQWLADTKHWNRRARSSTTGTYGARVPAGFRGCWRFPSSDSGVRSESSCSPCSA